MVRRMNFATSTSGAFYSDLERIRAGLASVKAGAFDAIEFKCFNEAEAQELRAHLSIDERAKVKFSWEYAGGLI
jgi:hypothetical protein